MAFIRASQGGGGSVAPLYLFHNGTLNEYMGQTGSLNPVSISGNILTWTRTSSQSYPNTQYGTTFSMQKGNYSFVYMKIESVTSNNAFEFAIVSDRSSWDTDHNIKIVKCPNNFSGWVAIDLQDVSSSFYIQIAGSVGTTKISDWFIM